MKKIVFFVSVLVLGLTSCNKDDDNIGENVASASLLEGKWEISKQGFSGFGTENFADYDHTEGCTKDFVIFTSTTFTSKTYTSDDVTCNEYSEVAPYFQNENSFTIMSDGEGTTVQIFELNETTLKIGVSDNIEGQPIDYITIFNRI